jgi:hypothetical protein
VTIALGTVVVPLGAFASTAAAAPPGQCKQVNGNCNGNSDTPHCDQFSYGWQKKLGCA